VTVQDDLIRQGVEHHRSGRLEQAKHIYDQLLAINSRHPDALHLRGLIALQEGDAVAAVDLLKAATRAQPKNPAFKGNLASALMQTGKLDAALAEFRRAAQLKPDEAQFQMGIANCQAMRGEHALAERQFRVVTERFPGFALAWFNLGNVVREQGRSRDAIAIFQRAIELDPNLIAAHINLGATLLAMGKQESAETAFRHALALSPDDPQILCNLASALIDRGKFSEAEAACRAAIAVAPDLAVAHSFLGAASGHQGRLLEAIELHRRAAELAPDDLRSTMALGIALFEIGDSANAIPLLNRAIELAPEAWQAQMSLGTAQLALGNFAEGWVGYFRRTGRLRFAQQYPGLAIDSNLPATLAGAKLCLLNEQGLGDQLFLLRWVEELKAKGAHIAYRPEPKLAGIVGRLPLIDQLVSADGALPAAEHYIMLGDLPCLLSRPPVEGDNANQNSADVPKSIRVEPLASHVSSIREQLLALGPPPYIGVTWRGGTPPEEQAGDTAWMLFKETPAQQLAGPLGKLNGTLLALQRKPAAGEIEKFSQALQKPLHDLSECNENLEDMLALLALIDDYVGVSNTNMHLRACVGRTARVLVPCPPEWRWMASGDESPWFPGFRIYRQKNNGDWSDALSQLDADLQNAFPAAAG